MTVTEVLLPIKHTAHITGNVTEDTHGYIVLVTEYDSHWSVITNQTHYTSLALLLKIPMVTLC